MKCQPQRKVNQNNQWLDRRDPVLKQFLKDISHKPMLPDEEIRKLIPLAKNGNVRARDKIVESNYRLLVRIAKEFQSNNMSINDLIQEGFFGLLFAINKYDISKEIPFVNYASWWIKTKMLKYIWWNQTTVRLPESQRSDMNKLLTMSEEFIQREHRVPSMEELLDACSMSEKVISKFLELFSDGNLRSTEDIQAMSDNDDIPDPTEVNPEEVIDSSIRHDALMQCIGTLKKKDQEFLKDYYGLGRPALLQKEMAKKRGRTVESLRLRHHSIIKRLQQNCMEDLSKYID